jgi:uncharacterized membrane protein
MLSAINQVINSRKTPWVIISVFALIYFLIVVCNHYFFRTFSFDYAAYNFAFYDYAHFRNSENGIYFIPTMTFLQDHVSFTLMIFTPLYWLFGWITGTYTLLLIQTVFILCGGLAVYRLILLKTRSNLLSVLALLQYFFIIGRWTSFWSDCNLAIIASSMIPVFIYFFETKKLIPTLLSFLFILTSREDMALWTAFIGLFLLIYHYKDTMLRNLSAGVIILSVIYFILVFSIIIPAIETPEKKFSLFNYSALGKGPSEALRFMISHPLETIRLFFINQSGKPVFNDIKPEFYIYYLSFGGFLLFFNPKYLLIYIPILAKKMLNDEPIRWSIETYYSIEFVSMLPVTTFLIISEFKNKHLRNSLTGIVCATTLLFTIYAMDSPNRRLRWFDDRKYAFYKSTMYKADIDVNKVYGYLKLIPPDAKVSASGTIAPHLAFREKIYYFPRVDDAAYIVVFQNRDIYPLTRDQFNARLDSFKNSSDWKTIVNDSPILILKRKSGQD